MAAATVWTYFRRFFNQDVSGESHPGPDLHQEREEEVPLESNSLQDERLNGGLGKSFATGHSKATKEKNWWWCGRRFEPLTQESFYSGIGHPA